MAPRIRALLPVLLLVLAAPTFAGVPAPPPASSLPFCFAACPMGDLPFTLTVRDIAMNPVAGSTVVIDFSNCPGAFLCASPPPPYNQNLETRQISGTTDATGKIMFPLHVGGVCGPGGVKVYADGVQLASYALASPDQNGDGLTLNSFPNLDGPLFHAKEGTNDPTADFDCDGTVEYDDALLFNNHQLQTCSGVNTHASKSSWGRLKSIYR